MARAALLAALVALLLLLAGWLWLSRTITNYPGAHFDAGTNAIWLEHTWAGDQHSAADYDALAARLTRERIGYVFAHVGPLDSTGALPADRAPAAPALVHALRQRAPRVKVLAWLGQVEKASGLPDDQTVDLGDPHVRQTIAATAAFLAGPVGFDGVHFDIEPMLNNSPHFLDLLDTARAAMPPAALISTSAPMWAPNAHAAEWLRSTIGRGAGLWTSYYYAAVATHVDQLVVMDYNTAIPSGPAYQVFVQQQTKHILEAVRSARHPPQVLIGLPTYHDNGFWFHDAAENLRNGLAGVTAGLNASRDDTPFAGVAIYRYATTDADAWATYERQWLGR
ncbi:MAG TPA: glycosyl hydrolase family 18 protein [Ktedonobacterales bacterium]|nr:glycosyl hydrolase family 18 protein [Ktedonobacterales bacterium]